MNRKAKNKREPRPTKASDRTAADLARTCEQELKTDMTGFAALGLQAGLIARARAGK
jgi:hypothetical protein